MRLALILLLSASLASAQESLPHWDASSVKSWWDNHSTPGTWSQDTATLDRQLQAYYQKLGSSAYADETFQGWFESSRWLQLGTTYASQLQDDASRDAFIALGQPGGAGLLLARHLSPGDKPAEALSILLNLQKAAAQDVAEFPALAVAYALVFDQPFPTGWPHFQVARTALPTGDLDPVLRFAFYVQACRDKKTEFDLRELDVPELIHVVDCPLSLSELAYGQKNHTPLTQFEHLFLDINYDMGRYDKKEWSWTGPTYLLQDIEKKGGICVDQAYHAAMMGKGRGIPTLLFTGQGKDGGHAWVGYLTHINRWETDCGRYANQNFVVGYARDPQTWHEIKDAELVLLSRCSSKNPNYRPAMTALAWAATRSEPAEQQQTLEEARSLMPELPAAWQAESVWLQKNNTDDSVAREFYEAWVKQFSGQHDMKTEGQELLVQVLKRNHDPTADSLQNDMVSENRSKRADLSIGVGYKTVSDKIAAQDWDGADQEYQKLIRRFGENNGGNLVQELVFPYVLACAKAGETARAENALNYAEKRIPTDSKSILHDNFKKLHDYLDKVRAAAQNN